MVIRGHGMVLYHPKPTPPQMKRWINQQSNVRKIRETVKSRMLTHVQYDKMLVTRFYYFISLEIICTMQCQIYFPFTPSCPSSLNTSSWDSIVCLSHINALCKNWVSWLSLMGYEWWRHIACKSGWQFLTCNYLSWDISDGLCLVFWKVTWI
jgi:hypothetical protein